MAGSSIIEINSSIAVPSQFLLKNIPVISNQSKMDEQANIYFNTLVKSILLKTYLI